MREHPSEHLQLAPLSETALTFHKMVARKGIEMGMWTVEITPQALLALLDEVEGSFTEER